MDAVIILSGGMDSTTLLYDLLAAKMEVFALIFDYSQKHRKEIACAEATCKKLGVSYKIIPLDILNTIAPSALTRKDVPVPDGEYNEPSMKTTVVPNRNMVMLSLATAFAIGVRAKKVFYGAHSGDHAIYPDCRPTFYQALKEAISLCDWNEVELCAPYLKMDKGDIAIRGTKLGVDYSLTWSCYKGGEKPCGTCGACTERRAAFEKAGVNDAGN